MYSPSGSHTTHQGNLMTKPIAELVSDSPWKVSDRNGRTILDRFGVPICTEAGGWTRLTDAALAAQSPIMASWADRASVFLFGLAEILEPLSDDRLGYGESGGAQWSRREELLESAKALLRQRNEWMQSLILSVQMSSQPVEAEIVKPLLTGQEES